MYTIYAPQYHTAVTKEVLPTHSKSIWNLTKHYKSGKNLRRTSSKSSEKDREPNSNIKLQLVRKVKKKKNIQTNRDAGYWGVLLTN